MTEQPEISVIAQQNDAFRQAMGEHPVFAGRLVATRGVATLAPEHVSEVLESVRTFQSFGDGNDPYGHHDFGAIECRGENFFWKIDLYDSADCQFGSEAPEDPASTYRLLTVMLASDY